MIKLQRVSDARAGSIELGKKIEAEINKKPNIVLGLITGSTPIELYKYWSSNADHCNWSAVTTFNLDEYVGLSPDDTQSYHYFMNQQLFKNINIKKGNIHLPNSIGNLEVNIQEYSALLNKKKIDIQLLGLGENGHIGFNEPGSLITDQTRVVNLAAETIQVNQRFFQSITAVPTQAITMGISEILKAKKIILMAFGIKKSQAIKQLMEGEISSEWPCTYLKNHPDLQVIADDEACSLLTKNQNEN